MGEGEYWEAVRNLSEGEDPMAGWNSSAQCCKAMGRHLILLGETAEPKLTLKKAFIIVIHIRSPLGKSLSSLKHMLQREKKKRPRGVGAPKCPSELSPISCKVCCHTQCSGSTRAWGCSEWSIPPSTPGRTFRRLSRH